MKEAYSFYLLTSSQEFIEKFIQTGPKYKNDQIHNPHCRHASAQFESQGVSMHCIVSQANTVK